MSRRYGKPSLGILGTARINRRVIPAIRAARCSSLAAIASRERARVARWAPSARSLQDSYALTVPNPFRPGPLGTLELERAGTVERIDVPGSPVIFVREVEPFEASVLDGAPPIVSLAESRRTAAMLSAPYASARDTATLYPQ